MSILVVGGAGHIGGQAATRVAQAGLTPVVYTDLVVYAAEAVARSQSCPSAEGTAPARYGRASGDGSAVYVGSSGGSRVFRVRTVTCAGSQVSNGG